MKIYHHNDLDGRCAGAIALIWSRSYEIIFGKAETIEIDYKDKVEVDQIDCGERIIIVDFSFKPETMIPLLSKGVHVVWIDHHKTAEEYNYPVTLPGLRDFSDNGMAGCELSWMYFFPGKPVPRAIELLGDYDKWALKLQPDCFYFYEGLKMEVTTPQSVLWERLFAGTNILLLEDILKRGSSAIRYQNNYCEKICHDFGYEIEWEGHKAFATNFYQFGSKGFGELMDKYAFCVAYIHDGKKFTVSLYSVRDVDVSFICKKHGGGGHKGAAGFVCDKLPWLI